MGCSSFNDKYQECEFLIEELKLIILHSSSHNYTENEQKEISKYKFEKKDKILIFIDELEKTTTDEFQKRKVIKLKNDFNEIIDYESISSSNNVIE